MESLTQQFLDNISKAMWAGDVRRAYELSESVDIDPRSDPKLYHDKLLNLVVFGTILKESKASEYKKNLELLYKKIEPYSTRDEGLIRKSRREGKTKLARSPDQMSVEETLGYVISPVDSVRQL